MNFIETLRMITSLLPIIIDAIKAVEAAVPEGKGKEKLDAVLGILATAGDVVRSILPSISPVVGVLVTLFNATGVFKKTQP